MINTVMTLFGQSDSSQHAKQFQVWRFAWVSQTFMVLIEPSNIFKHWTNIHTSIDFLGLNMARRGGNRMKIGFTSTFATRFLEDVLFLPPINVTTIHLKYCLK